MVIFQLISLERPQRAVSDVDEDRRSSISRRIFYSINAKLSSEFIAQHLKSDPRIVCHQDPA